MAAPAWTGWIIEEVGAWAQAQTDDEIEQYIRNTSSTVDHVSGTVAMGKTGSTGSGTGALNSDLTVKGTVGLRVVDASVFVSFLFFLFWLAVFNGLFICYIAVHTSSSYDNANICCCRTCFGLDQTSMGVTLLKASSKQF